MNKKIILESLKGLIEKYEQAKKSNQIGKYSEEETKKDFILPLFKILGWNVFDRSEVSAEEHIISSGRVDYGFYINNRPKLYLEAKKLKVDLNIEGFARQAIRYSFNRGVTWAILTDFESIKVFNAQALSNYLGDKLYFEIKYSQYLDRFDQLWLLSKESFSSDSIDREAEKAGKKLQRVPITELLFKDLNDCRRILTEYLGKWNPKVPKDLLDEGVQKLLDRLIFIRVAEDRKIEHNILTPLISQWRVTTGKNKPELYESMRIKFRELDDIYNSNLFSPHPFERWEDDGGALEKVINILHGKEGYYEYDFSIMPADILGGVYENYLGYKLSQSEKGLTLDKAAGKRKEQGIYYTPTFIVDYIVRNALKPVLDRCKSVNDLMKIKVLDPACGSGSFLIKALDIINEKYKEFGYEGNEFTKIQIILQNLYGVDLDEQAVEIARLNLLINTLEERGKLPSLDQNIKNGNSLISGTDEELQKYFGKNFRDKKPFNWEEEFPEVIKQGGFDVVIGNPPYINAIQLTKTIGEEIKSYWKDKFYSARGTYDIYVLFFEKSLNLCKKGGCVSFITPNKYLSSPYGIALREHISKNYKLIKVTDLSGVKVFDSPSVYPVITLIQNEKTEKDYYFFTEKILSEDTNNKSSYKISSKTLRIIPDGIWGVILSNKVEIIEKIFKISKPLSEVAEVQATSTASEADEYSKYINESKIGISIINTGTIDRYKTTFGISKLTDKGKQLKEPFLDISKINVSRKKLYMSPKIIISKLGLRAEGFLDRDGKFASINTNCIHHPQKGYSLDFLIAILNSKLFSFVYSEIFSGLKMGGGYFQFQAPQLRIMPIVEPSATKNGETRILVAKIIELNDKLNKTPENSNKWNTIKEEIGKTDRKIDEEVYQLYGLTPEEIEIVEGKSGS